MLIWCIVVLIRLNLVMGLYSWMKWVFDVLLLVVSEGWCFSLVLILFCSSVVNVLAGVRKVLFVIWMFGLIVFLKLRLIRVILL